MGGDKLKKILIFTAILLVISFVIYQSPDDNFSSFDDLPDYHIAIENGKVLAKALYCSNLSFKLDVNLVSSEDVYDTFLKEKSLSLEEISNNLDDVLSRVFWRDIPHCYGADVSDDLGLDFDLAAFDKHENLVVLTYVLTDYGQYQKNHMDELATYKMILRHSRSENDGPVYRILRKVFNLPIIKKVTGGSSLYHWKIIAYDYNFSEKMFFDYLVRNGEDYLSKMKQEIGKYTEEYVTQIFSEENASNQRTKRIEWAFATIEEQEARVQQFRELDILK